MKRTLTFAAVVLAASLLLHAQTNRSARTDTDAASGPATALRALEQDWANAVKLRDIAALARIEADDYEFTDPGGQLWTKARQLEVIKAGDLEIDSFELSEFKARLYGDTAVVSFRIMWTGRYRGNDISGPQRVTDVFVKREGRWQCVSGHTTRLTQP